MAEEQNFGAARQKLRDTAAYAYQQAVNFDSYQRFEGVTPIPVMGPIGTPPVLARTHAPYGIRRAEFEYARDRVPPLVPAPADTDSGDTVISSEYVFPTPRVNANGSLTYGVRGEIVFVQAEGGRGTESEFEMSLHPFVSPLDAVHTLPGPSGDPEADMAWQWNSRNYDMRTLGSYGIIL